jgi:V8-like Glu-specific endopeptidase
MRYPTFLKLGLALILLPATAMAGTVSLENTHKKAAKHWTAERYAAARPLPLRQAEPGIDPFPEALEAAEAALESQSAAGRAPIAGVRANPSNRLFEPQDRELAALSAEDSIAEPASGSGGGYFTSSRLVPVSADRSYPYSTVGKLFFTIPGEGDFYCSAAVIRSRIVATAAQCIHGGLSAGDFFDNLEFVPAYRDGVAPFGSWEWEFVSVPSAWTTGKGKLPSSADFGLIEVEDIVFDGALRRLGDVVGFLGYATQRLRPNHAHLLAYTSSFDGGEKLHQVTAKDAKTASPSNVLYGSDMRGGSAGGPLIQDFGDNALLVKWVGAISTFNSSSAVKLQGAAIPDSKFTSVLGTVCNHRAGNC